MLRRAGAARRPARRGARVCAPHDRRRSSAPASNAIVVNAAGCGSSMKEYGELLADDPAWADRARAFAARVRDVTEIAGRARPAAGAAASARAARRVSRRLPPRARAGRPAAAARSAARRFPASSCCRSPIRTSAAAAPASTTWSSRTRRGSSAIARPASSTRRNPMSSRPRTPAACCRSRPPPGGRAARGRSAIRSRSSTPRFVGSTSRRRRARS